MKKRAMVIPTPRLILREFRPDDWRRIFEYQSEPEYARFNSWNQRSIKDVKAFVERFVQWQSEIPRLRFQMAIIHRAEERLIGNCGIRGTAPFCETELGFELDRLYWHQGFATEAAHGILEFAFSNLQVQRVKAQCVTENVASAKVLRRLGMNYDKTERNSMWMKDKWWDTDQFSLTKEEWERSFRTQEAESLRR